MKDLILRILSGIILLVIVLFVLYLATTYFKNNFKYVDYDNRIYRELVIVKAVL